MRNQKAKSSMNKITIPKLGIFMVLAAATLMTGMYFKDSSDTQAQTSIDAPQFEVLVSGTSDHTPTYPNDCGNGESSSGSSWGSTSTGTINNSREGGFDTHCVKLRFKSGYQASSYTSDFRICVTLSGRSNSASGCTPYASEGGGWIPQLSMNSGQFSTVSISTETKAAPSGEYYSDADLLSVLYYKSSSDNHCGAGANSYAYASRTNDPSWAWSQQSDDDPGCAQFGLNVVKHSVYNGQFVRSAIDNNTATSANTYSVDPNSAANAHLYMHNTGNPWYSDATGTLASGSQDCSNFNYQNDGDSCTETRNYSSSDIVLSRIDSTTGITAPSEIPYVKQVTTTYTAHTYVIDPGDPPGDPGGCAGGGIKGDNQIQPICEPQAFNNSDTHNIFASVIKDAKAQTTSGLVVEPSSSDSKDIYSDPETNFPFTVTTGSSSGTYPLQYKLKKKSGAAPGTDSNGYFGDVANLTIVIGNGATLNCSAYSSVTAGDVADFAVSASGVSSPITVTMSSNPTGPTLSNSPLTLNDANTYADVAHVATTGVAAGDYILTFSGSNGTSCQSQLNIVQTYSPSVNLLFDGTKTPPKKSVGDSGTISWTSHDMSRCDADQTTGTNWGGQNIGLNGSQASGVLSTDNTKYTFSIHCTGLDGLDYPDSVSVDVGNPPPVCDVNCDDGGGTDKVDIKCEGLNDSTFINGPCIINNGSYGMLSWSTKNMTACTIDQGFGSVTLQNDPPGTTTGNLSAPKTTFTLSCTGPNYPASTPKKDSVDFVTDTAPDAPQLAADNSLCGQVVLSWKVTRGSDPATFRVYNGSSINGPWNQISTVNFTDRATTYTYNDRPAQTGTTHYYAVEAVSVGGLESSKATVQIVPNPCGQGSLNTSDKDLKAVKTAVGNFTKDFNPPACTDNSEVAVLPNNALFGVADLITFQLNVCNSGTDDIGNVTINDTLHNLSDAKLLSSLNSFSSPNCVTGFAYNSQTQTISMGTVGIPKPAPSQKEYCSIIFTARVAAPSNPSAAVYRFQNEAWLTAAGLSKHVFTPPYLFSISGGVPERNETPPQ